MFKLAGLLIGLMAGAYALGPATSIMAGPYSTPQVVGGNVSSAQMPDPYVPVDGTANITGGLAVSGAATVGAATGITAFAGGGQASATTICDTTNVADLTTVASTNDSVKFTTPTAGKWCWISNRGAARASVFPASGGTLCHSGSACAAADAALNLEISSDMFCVAISATVWRCTPHASNGFGTGLTGAVTFGTVATFNNNIRNATSTSINGLSAADVDWLLADNSASATAFRESTNVYLEFVSTNGGEVNLYSKPMKPLIATPVASAGTDITNCGAIPAGTVALQVTGADGTKGACLPTTASVTTCVRIMNPSASVLKIYGADADTSPTVNGGAGDAAYSQIAGSSLLYCNSGVAWTSY